MYKLCITPKFGEPVLMRFLALIPLPPLLPQGEKGEQTQMSHRDAFRLPSPAQGEGGGEGNGRLMGNG